MLASSTIRSTASARLLWQGAQTHGMSDAAFFDGTGLAWDHLEDETAEIAAADEVRLVENMVDALGGEPGGIGLEVGSACTLSMFGMFGFAVTSAGTLREAWEVSGRYQDLASTLARVDVVSEARVTYLQLDLTALPERVHRFVVDHFFATCWAATLAMEGTPQQPLIDLACGRARVGARYLKAFGVEPRYDCARDRFGYPDWYLDRPRPWRNAAALALSLQHCADVMERRRQRQIGMADLVLEQLNRATRLPSMEVVAADLHVSARTLRRRLATDHTSFRQLDEAAKRARAADLLRTTTLPVAAVAEHLGYATASAFSRAFRRWHGTSPATWRSSHAPPRRAPNATAPPPAAPPAADLRT